MIIEAEKHTSRRVDGNTCVLDQSSPTLCDPMEHSPPGSPVHGVLQARILEWVSISYSRDLPNPGIKPMSPAKGDRFFTTAPPGKT